VITYAGDWTWTVKDDHGEPLRRELLTNVPEALALERAEVKLYIARYHASSENPNYNTALELALEVQCMVEVERGMAWPDGIAKQELFQEKLHRWVRATQLLVSCIMEQAQIHRSSAYDMHGNVKKNGGLACLEKAIMLYSHGESVYTEPRYSNYGKNTVIDISRVRYEVEKCKVDSLAAQCKDDGNPTESRMKQSNKSIVGSSTKPGQIFVATDKVHEDHDKPQMRGPQQLFVQEARDNPSERSVKRRKPEDQVRQEMSAAGGGKGKAPGTLAGEPASMLSNGCNGHNDEVSCGTTPRQKKRIRIDEEPETNLKLPKEAVKDLLEPVDAPGGKDPL